MSNLARGEESISLKVQELTLALNQIREYSRVSRSALSFVIVGLGPILVWPAFGFNASLYLILSSISDPFSPERISTYQLLVLVYFLVPTTGIVFTILYTIRKTSFVSRKESNVLPDGGVANALKTLSDLDWKSVYADIATAKFGYAIHAGQKLLTYWTIGFPVVGSLGDFGLVASRNLTNSLLFAQFLTTLWAGLAFLLVVVSQRKQILGRYLTAFSLDTLLWELRWFAYESQGTDLKT